MQVASLRWKFAREHVRETPDLQGVFSLWNSNECVYIGHTPWNHSLRDCLQELLAQQQEGAIEASHFTWETTPTPKTREGDLLAICINKLGRLPRYNRKDSPLPPTHTCVTDLRAKKSGPNPG